MISNSETVKVTLKAEFQYSSRSQWLSGAETKCVLGTVPWCLRSEEAFGITELFKQAAQVTDCTQESRERDLALTTPPGPVLLRACVRVCVCVSERFRGKCVSLIEKDKDICVCYVNKRAAEISALARKFPLSPSHHPAFNAFQKPTVCH